jgi:PqqD family protein of HPr-rel-A system
MAPLMSDDTKRATFKRDTALPFQRMSEELLVVDPKARNVHLLNETGGRIWELLGETTSVDALVEALADEYEGATPEALRAEVEAFLADLDAKGLLGGARSKA